MADKLTTNTNDKNGNVRQTEIIEIPETSEYEITEKETKTEPERKVRFPIDETERYKLPPDEFSEVQASIEHFLFENRKEAVYNTSLESCIGYDALVRVLNKRFRERVAYYRSKEGGELTYEEARRLVYSKGLNDNDGSELFEKLHRVPTNSIGFLDLLSLYDKCPAMAENLWETIKKEAQNEFESGHRAAEVFEPANYMKDAWNRASYLGLRESFIQEYDPRGGIELTMIDAIVQAWLQLQYWTEQSVRRTRTEPRTENEEFHEWKMWNKEAFPKQWHKGHWDLPYVHEIKAIEHATQMVDRWQKMYFRAIRNLRDWRRYSPQLTINKPNQVNIATDGGQQVNVSKNAEE